MILLIANGQFCSLRSTLSGNGHNFAFLSSGKDSFSHDLDATLENRELEIVVIDCQLNDNKGLKLLTKLKKRRPDVPVLFVCSSNSERTIFEALRLGARDCFKKPVEVQKFKERIIALQKMRGMSHERRVPFKTLNRHQTYPTPFTTDMPENILRTIYYIDNNLADHTLTIERLAEKAGMSKYHFCRVFKRYAARSPMQYVSYMRVAKAKDLLKYDSGNMTISLIASAVGFYDASNFNKNFKKVTGLTPSTYRQSVAHMKPR